MSQNLNEFSRLIEIKKLTSIPKEYVLTPTHDEQKDLAQRFHIHELSQVNSTLNISKIGSKVLIEGFAKGQFQLHEDSKNIDFQEDIKVLLFTDKSAKDFDPQRLEDDVHDSWDCDVLEDEALEIDIGEIIAQYISLSIIDGDFSSPDGKLIELF